MDIDKIKNATALRVFAKDDQLDQAAAELCRKAKDTELLPHSMQFEQSIDYEISGEYQVILWCT